MVWTWLQTVYIRAYLGILYSCCHSPQVQDADPLLWYDAGPASQTVDQHHTSIRSTSRLFVEIYFKCHVTVYNNIISIIVIFSGDGVFFSQVRQSYTSQWGETATSIQQRVSDLRIILMEGLIPLILPSLDVRFDLINHLSARHDYYRF